MAETPRIAQAETASEIIKRLRRLTPPSMLAMRALDQELVRIELERLLTRLLTDRAEPQAEVCGATKCTDELEESSSRLARSPQLCRHGNDREQCTDEACYLASRSRSPQPEGWQPSIELIASERQRQVTTEGWTPNHDDTHMDGEMIEGARCYLSAAFIAERGRHWTGEPPPLWPWNQSWWKPSKYPVQNLMKAGALIAAEIDRLLRSTGEAVSFPAATRRDQPLKPLQITDDRLPSPQAAEAREWVESATRRDAPQERHEEDLTRVEPRSSASTDGIYRDQSPGAVTAAERTEKS